MTATGTSSNAATSSSWRERPDKEEDHDITSSLPVATAATSSSVTTDNTTTTDDASDKSDGHQLFGTTTRSSLAKTNDGNDVQVFVLSSKTNDGNDVFVSLLKPQMGDNDSGPSLGPLPVSLTTDASDQQRQPSSWSAFEGKTAVDTPAGTAASTTVTAIAVIEKAKKMNQATGTTTMKQQQLDSERSGWNGFSSTASGNEMKSFAGTAKQTTTMFMIS